MIAKKAEEMEKLHEIGSIVASCLKMMSEEMRPGQSTWELDQLAKQYLGDHGATSAPIHCYDFPGYTCISVAHQVAHGIPSKKNYVQEADLINIDVSALKDGYFADTGGSFLIPPKVKAYDKLLKATKKALDFATQAARAGKPIRNIGKAIESVAKEHGYSIIRNLGSHGIGKTLHDYPNFIPGFDDPNEKRLLEEGMVITIEPFLSTGADFVLDEGDGWTLVTEDKFRTAQFEYTMIITKKEPIITTQA